VRVLAIDVGFGTSDILLHDDARRGENQTHLVVPSGTQVVASEIRDATVRGLDVVMRGRLMGGGPCAKAMERHLQAGLRFFAEPDAARTFDDDLELVAGMGVSIVSTEEAAAIVRTDACEVRSGDVRRDLLEEALHLLGETAPVDGWAVAVQDHGEAPRGVSDRVFRFEKLIESLSRSRRLSDLFHSADDVPRHFTRLRAAGECVSGREPVVVGDTGPSALWGAALTSAEPSLVINYGNGHTLMALVRGDELDGLFEHHTGLLDGESMRFYIEAFMSGTLSSETVLADGGHGVLPLSEPVGPGTLDVLLTGPNRTRFLGLVPREIEVSIHGDMMLTGCYGLLEGYRAVQAR
jgi:uncharacterized protein (DUF1786 family)